jgi:DNA adenine methylase
VQRTATALCAALRALACRHTVEQYYAVRKRYNATTPADGLPRCAQFIYLNKTCFNGLHRVNRRGEFNVPAGRYANPRILDEDVLRAASHALGAAQLMCGSFEEVLQTARAGDFVYLDPPYDVENDAAGFTAYAASPFGPSAQDALAHVFQALDRRGCKLLLSNSATRANRDRYAGYQITEVVAPRSISRSADQRHAVVELAVRNYNS